MLNQGCIAQSGHHRKEILPLFLIVCGYNKACRPGYRISRGEPGHEFYSIELVLSGQGEYSCGSQIHQLRPGSFFLYGPGVAHSYRSFDNDPLEKYWICFLGAQAPALMTRLFGGWQGAYQLRDPRPVLMLAELIIAQTVNHGPLSTPLCDSLLEPLMLAAAANLVPLDSTHEQARNQFELCRRIIDHEYRQMHSPYTVCQQVHISPSYLCRLYRRYAGETPFAHLTRLKMHAAAYQLTATAGSIKQVSGDLGFSDQYNFSRAFKQFFGMSPNKYRRSDTPPATPSLAKQ